MAPEPDPIPSSVLVRSPEVNAEQPWLGLLPYKEEHHDFFFGRDREVEDILGRIRDNSLTILYGQSGLGKSSLLAAGVMPRLRLADYAPRWARLDFTDSGEGRRHQTLVQQTQVLISAAQGLLKAEDFDSGAALQQMTFWERFHHRDSPVSPTPVLIFDQFEEIFTLGANSKFESEVAEWLEQMADLLQNRPPRHLERLAQDPGLAGQYHFDAAAVRIVFTLREDYLAQLERWKARLPLLMQNRMALTLLTGPQARQAVLGPAQMGDHSLVSREVADSIVRTVARVPADTPLDQIKAVPPLLSLLCEQLNTARLEAGRAQITAESVRDQAADILQRFYEESFLGFPQEHRGRIRALLEDPPMITEAGHRNALVREDAEAQLRRAGVADVSEIFDTLIQRRLITTETQDQVQRLEVTHDVLVPLLLRSRKERQDREAKEKAERAALAAKAEQGRLAQERRRLRFVAGVMTLLFIAALGFAGYGWWQAGVARRAEDKAETARIDAEKASRSAERERLGAVEASQRADQAKQSALSAAENEKVANAKNLRTLHEASMADYAVAVQRIEKEHKWHEGVAHLARSLKWEPANTLAAARLYSTLSLYAAEKQSWPRQILRHKGWVLSAQFSADGRRIVTASADKTAQVWDAASGKLLGEALRHEDEVTRAEFSADGTRIVTVSGDKAARVWNAASGKLIGEPLRHTDYINGAKFSRDGTRIVTGSWDKTAQMWDTASGKPIGEPLRHEDIVFDAQFSPDGTRIVTTSRDMTARVWDAASGRPLGEPLRHGNTVFRAQFSPDGTRIVTASVDKTARMGDAVSGSPLGEPLRHEDEVHSAQFSADGMRVITASADGTARVWDAASGKPLGEPLRHAGPVNFAEFSGDGTRIVTASADGTVRVWDAASGKPLGEPLHHEAYVTSLQFSADGMHIVTSSQDGTARVWNTSSGKPPGEPLRHEGHVASAQFSLDGRHVVTASWDKTARVWDASSGKPLGRPLSHEGEVDSAQFNADGTRVLTTSWDKTARMWDAVTGKPIGEPMRHEETVESVQFSADGTRILTASLDKTARVWDAVSGKPLGEPLRHESGVRIAKFSADGSRIVTASMTDLSDIANLKTAKVRLWDATSRQPVGEPLRHDGDVSSAEFSADSRRVLTASWDHTAQVWDADSGKPIGEPLSHERTVMGAEFSADGAHVVTVSDDATARVWDATSGKALGEPLRHEGSVQSAHFSADGTRVITASHDTTVRVWDAASGKPIGEPLRHETSVDGTQFSADGTRIITAGRDNVARLWDAKWLTQPLPSVPEWMLGRVWAIAGLEFDADGQMKTMPDQQRLATLSEATLGEDAWAKLARWLVLPAEGRPLTPESNLTRRQMAERERDSGTQEGIESALRYDPSVPLAHLMLAKFVDVPERAAFLREYELKHLPDDAALWSRASVILRNRLHFSQALEAARKAVALDGGQISALRTLALALGDSKQPAEAQPIWEKVLADKGVTSRDFGAAGDLAAKLNQEDKARALFREGETRFPEAADILHYKGRALLVLQKPAEALATLQAHETKLGAQDDGSELSESALACLAVTRWLTGDKDGAVAECQRLIGKESDYADLALVPHIYFPDAIKVPLLEVLTETLKRHPELVPKEEKK